jgi:hypothetical protein
MIDECQIPYRNRQFFFENQDGYYREKKKKSSLRRGINKSVFMYYSLSAS